MAPFKKKSTKWILIIAAVLLAMVLTALLLIWHYYNSKLDLIQYDNPDRAVELDPPTLTKPPADRVDGKKETLPGGIYHDEDVLNILLLGTDDRTEDFSDDARSDSIMLLSLDKEKHTARLVSIERGIGVPVPGRNDDWITHTFRYGGAELTMQTVRDCFKVDVDRYVRVNLSTFETGIDAIGGVDITITQAESEYMNSVGRSQYGIPLPEMYPGENHMDGPTALVYARARKLDSDWGRIVRQRTVVQAAVNQVKDLSFSELNELVNTILPLVNTNLTRRQITSLVWEMPRFAANGAQIEQMTIPTDDTCWDYVGVTAGLSSVWILRKMPRS